MANKYRKGKVKREHTIIGGILPLLDQLASCPFVHAITPGPISPNPSNGVQLKFQYYTDQGFKLLAQNTEAIQEVFVVSSQPEKARAWAAVQGLVEAEPVVPEPWPAPSPHERTKQITLLSDGVCPRCGSPLRAGTRATRIGPKGAYQYVHPRCAK